MCNRFVRTITVLGLLWGQAALAQIDPWERVKLIEPGKRVAVQRLGSGTVNGRMQDWSSEAVTVVQGRGKVTQIAKSDVKSVAIVGGWSRAKKAGVAGLAGAGIGFAIGAAACHADDCYASPGAVGAGFAVFIGGIAAGIAALFPQHHEVIYTANPGRTP